MPFCLSNSSSGRGVILGTILVTDGESVSKYSFKMLLLKNIMDNNLWNHLGKVDLNPMPSRLTFKAGSILIAIVRPVIQSTTKSFLTECLGNDWRIGNRK